MLLVDPLPIDRTRAEQLFRFLRSGPYYRIQERPGEMEKRVSHLLDGTGQGTATRWDWFSFEEWEGKDPSKDIGASSMQFSRFKAVNSLRFDWGGSQSFLLFWFGRRGTRWSGPFPPDDDPGKVAYLLEKWREVSALFEPEFAAIDDFEFALAKRRGKDLRRFGWGAAIYGPKLVKAIGPERFVGLPAWKVEVLRWGGIWVQAAEDPFNAPPEAKKAIEKHLELRKVFGG